MFNVTIEEAIRQISPPYAAAVAGAAVSESTTPETLWAEIETLALRLRTQYDTTSIKERSGIKATRMAYKASGVDPSRYRPSCEQLCRRVVQGKDLTSITCPVDIGNLLSMEFGHSVAVTDSDKISGNSIRFGIGKASEPYQAIGRGMLNITRIPVWRDALGGFATPTSDNVRTMCTARTRNLLVIINAFDGDIPSLREAVDRLQGLLNAYARCSRFEYQLLQ